MNESLKPASSVGVDPGLFPDENPNPVMRVAPDGTLSYGNASSQPIRNQLGVQPGDPVPKDFLESLRAGARFSPPQPFELECDVRTFAVLAVPVGEGFNVYGTDVTGVKVVEKFPDRNPNPVLRMNPEGRLLYANLASAPIVRALGGEVGRLLPESLHSSVSLRLAGNASGPLEVRGEGQIFELSPVRIPEFGFINLYGTDVTALRAIDKFPDANPNPVLRTARDGTITYANPAAAPLLRAFGSRVGERLPGPVADNVTAIVDADAPNVLQLEDADGRIFELRVVSLYEFESINLYGTDVTAAREVERANRENERLLLNILPQSIADRLRQGEEPIADALEDMAVLFADVVDFTPYSATHPAAEVVGVLNEIFSILDGLADRYRLEKIKTVGDAYMAAGGLTPEHGDATAVADMALAIVDELERYRTADGRAMQVRLGMHVGPGIGGVIGLKKFIYDVWGDTVNTASRMESHGVPNRVQVTADTVRRLGDHCRFERRGVIDVKGKGPVETFFLVGRVHRSTASPSD